MAVSIAVVAALMAGISMLGHRTHNEVLQLQGESNRLQTEADLMHTKANIDHTHATDQWGFYQAKNNREHLYTMNLGFLDVIAKDPSKEKEADQLRQKMKGQVDKYRAELPEMKAKAEELTAAGEKKQAEAAKRQEEAAQRLDESHHAHRQATRLDFAHLGAEIGIVLCSLALLTKKSGFWYAGLLAAVVAIGLTTSAYLVSEEHPHEHMPTASPESKGH